MDLTILMSGITTEFKISHRDLIHLTRNNIRLVTAEKPHVLRKYLFLTQFLSRPGRSLKKKKVKGVTI